MVSPILTIEPWKVVEKQGDRQPYIQYKDEKFVKDLFHVAKKVLDAPVTPTQYKKQYIDAIENINSGYFAAQNMTTTMQGQFHRYDATAENQLRETVASGVSRSVGDLQSLCDAHNTIIETTATQLAKRHRDPQTRREASHIFEQTIATCTIQAVRDGWFPTLELYHFSLNPGERVAEGRERREQRLYGTEETQGLADRLANSELEQITEDDLVRLKQINTKSNLNGHPVIHKLQTKYDWAVRS